MRAAGILTALSIALCVPLAGACCGAKGGGCAAARAAQGSRPHSAEFIFSNICDQTMLVRTVEVTAGEVTLVHPREKMGADGKTEGMVIAFGDEVFLGEGYFTPGEYRLSGKVTAVAKDDPGSTLELAFEVVMVVKGPVTVEVALGREGEGCGVSTEVTAGAGEGSLCYEPASDSAQADCGANP